MSINQISDLPSLLTEHRIVGPFLPPASFGYLYIITGNPVFLTAASLLMSSTTVLVLAFDEKNLTYEDLSTPQIFSILFTGGFLFIGGLTTSIILLYIYTPVTAGTLSTKEVVTTTLILGNVSYLSGAIFRHYLD